MINPREGALFQVSFSTMWGITNFPALSEFFQAAPTYGFNQIELNHQVSSSMLAGADLDAYRFSSIHEPCPADISTETLKERDWLISSLDEENRRQGIRSIQRSIDLAQTIGAGLIVIHAGSVRADASDENRLRKLFQAGEASSPGYQELKARLEHDRQQRSGAHLEAVLKSLQELVEYAGKRGIRLGVENRYHYFDIPLLDEMEACLSLVDHGQLGWVYDVGHAHALAQLGFIPEEAWLERYADRMVETHLHDITGIYDHLAPGLGEIDFARIAPYLPKACIRTCELRTENTPEQVKAGVQYLYEKGCITCQ